MKDEKGKGKKYYKEKLRNIFLSPNLIIKKWKNYIEKNRRLFNKKN